MMREYACPNPECEQPVKVYDDTETTRCLNCFHYLRVERDFSFENGSWKDLTSLTLILTMNPNP